MILKLFKQRPYSFDTLIRQALILLMLAASFVWLGYEFHRLLLDESLTGAIDLKQRYEELFFWFRGFEIYGVIRTATYPPASMVMLWPLLGWTGLPTARLIWALASILSLYWLIAIFLRESLAATRTSRLLVILIPLAMYSAGACIGNGQVIVLLLPPLLAGLLRLQRSGISVETDLTASLFFLFALIKPSMAVPFFWLVLMVPGRIRPALGITAGYAGLTFIAASFQPRDTLHLLLEWLHTSSEILAGLARQFSYNNIHSWLWALEMPQFIPLLSLSSLGLLGVWIWFNRKDDIWLIISVASLFARLWSYHAWYDDLLIAPALIALIRILHSRRLSGPAVKVTSALLYLGILLTMAPGGHYLLPPLWKSIYLSFQGAHWLALLIFLLWQIHREKSSAYSFMLR